ncbi:MAG: branched-chain amino acid ABC transporter permease [Lachnospiraceae bacterium]|nr:branched-chain amino acid ABC transporter permease [Lachnospiraceae bacterium]
MEQKKKIIPSVTGIAALLIFVILLENLSDMIPGLPQIFQPTSPLFTVLKKAAVYSLVAVSMNLLNGFTGLFSLGQAGFMLLGAYTYAILTVPAVQKDQVYYLFGGCAFNFSVVDMFQSFMGTNGAGGAFALVLGCLLALTAAGCVAGFFAYLIGFPVLRLKSDYLAIATLGFAEILRAIFQWQKLGPITNGANMIKGFPTFSSFNITDASGNTVLRLSTFVPFLITTVCILLIVLLIRSSYGRAFMSIRDDEIASEAMGIGLFKHKMLSFVISSFFAGIGGGLFAMYVANAQAKAFTSTMTYEILLIVVIGGIGSVSGSVLATFLYVACSEWWLRFLDSEMYIGSFKVPLLRNGFRMVVFSVVIMVIVLFFSQGIMGNREISLSGIIDRLTGAGKRKAQAAAASDKDGEDKGK